MKKRLGGLIARFREPRWRHGRLSAALMAAFVLVCVLLNVGVQALEDAFGWTRDFSFNGYATTGEETQKVLDRLETEVELYLLYQGGEENTEVLNLLKRYQTLCGLITVLPTDLARNPGILTRFQGKENQPVEADMVIVHCPATGRYRVLAFEDFLTYGYDLETGVYQLSGLAYEKKLTEAISFVAQETLPVVGVAQGHGELDADALNVLIAFLNSNNYAVREVNLLLGDSLEGVDALLFAAPQKDLTDGEAEALAAYAREGGHFLILRDYTDPLEGMPNYLALLRDYGVVPLPGVVAADAQETGSYYGDVFQLLPYMETLDITRELIATGRDILLMPYASAFETPGEPTASLTASTVLKTGPHAYVRGLNDGIDNAERQPDDRTGEISVALYAHRMFANGNVSRMFAMGASATFLWEYIYQSTYSEEFLMTILGELMPESKVSLDIMASTALRPSLAIGSRALGVALTIALPAFILLMGLCVLLPRRNR